MASINVDQKIVEFVKAHADRFGGKSLSTVIAEAILYLYFKQNECFCCTHHQSQVVGYYLGMQRKSLELSKGASDKSMLKPKCSNCDKRILSLAKDVADCSPFSSMAKIVNDALVEHITRPKECQSCPFYAPMRDKVEARLKGTDE